MYRRNDPRIRRTLNEISQTFESANETAQTSVFVFGQQYVSPCLHSIYASIRPCVDSCFPPTDQRGRRSRQRSRGQPELNFDFYDDWEEDENADLLGWDEDEYDGFMAGAGQYGSTSQQPGRQRAMSYGARRDAKGRPLEAGPDAAGAGNSYFNFIGKIRDKLGPGKGLRYMPSAAGLQEHPGIGRRQRAGDGEPLMTDESGEDEPRRHRRRRNRSGTVGSEHTTSSLSSRGDLFPSEDEDDAVPLDEEFAMVLERRTNNSGHDDGDSGGVSRSGKRPGLGSRRSTRTASSRSTPRSKKRLSRTASAETVENLESETLVVPTLSELKQEEQRVQMEEEQAIRERREAAQRLAADRGLVAVDQPSHDAADKEIISMHNEPLDAPTESGQAMTELSDQTGPRSRAASDTSAGKP